MPRELWIYFFQAVPTGLLAWFAAHRSTKTLSAQEKRHQRYIVFLVLAVSLGGNLWIAVDGAETRRVTEEKTKSANFARERSEQALAEALKRAETYQRTNTVLLDRLGRDTDLIKKNTEPRISPSVPAYRLGKAEYGGPFKVDDGDGRPPRTVYNTMMQIYAPKVVEHPYMDIYTDQPVTSLQVGYGGHDFVLYGDGAVDPSGKLIRAYAQGIYSPDSPIQLSLSGEHKVTVLKVLPVERR